MPMITRETLFDSQLVQLFAKKPASYALSVLFHVAILIAWKNNSQTITQKVALGFAPTALKVRSISELKQEIPKKKVLKKKKSKKVMPIPKPIEQPVQKQDVVNTQKVIHKDFAKSVVQNNPPLYPRVALRRGWTGKVLLQVLVGQNGKAKRVDILKPSKHQPLNKSAVQAALSWTFQRPQANTTYLVKKEIVFKLEKK